MGEARTLSFKFGPAWAQGERRVPGFIEGTFSPGWWPQPGLNVPFQPRSEAWFGSRPLLPVGGSNQE
jgi:hypothetical protein